MLHIITPLYRFHLLEKVYQTIPKQKDITWHIAKSTHREKLFSTIFDSDPRIQLYEIDCHDADLVTKRNVVFEKIQDGYFCLLDDDTIFLEELYLVYQEYSTANFIGMIIGDQKTLLGSTGILKASYPTNKPETTLIDAGMVICHHTVLRSVKWALSSTFRDREFWFGCYNYFGREATTLVNRTISVYNYFGPKIRVRKKIFWINFAFDIYNLRIAKLYTVAANYTDRILNFFQIKSHRNHKHL